MSISNILHCKVVGTFPDCLVRILINIICALILLLLPPGYPADLKPMFLQNEIKLKSRTK